MQNQKSAFAAKKEKGQASLFSFGIGKVVTDGRVPLPESHSIEEREGMEERAEPAQPKRRPGRPFRVPGTTIEATARVDAQQPDRGFKQSNL
jgi:hypothetical protein